ncbi:trigger factor [Armatimonas rosea]|uniref:Trigger factor n=1 Tax=Armatimonas rosea TaxID=685828 RepID=A0A7W9SPJ0_ARMRO|nr:trigger factor [Armatimonas rosea]MBB6049649.1 trigger factor [Armatimonas rosea]
MQVTTEQLDPCKIALTISVEPEKVEAARKKAFQQAISSLQLPGFRRGKVPPHIAKNYVDDGRVKQRAAESLVPDAYREALTEASVEAFAEPDMEFVSMEDGEAFVFKALVPLRPQVTLGLYKGLALERRNITITDSDVEKELENVRGRFAEYPEVEDRVTEAGDFLMVDLTAIVEGQDLPELAEPKATMIEIGKNIPDLDAGLVGLTKGETKTIEATYPETFENEGLRGKRGVFTVTLKEIRSRVLPELTDELAKRVNPRVESVEALTADIRTRLEKDAVEASENEVEFNLVSKIVETSQIHFPEVLLRAEVNAELQQLSQTLEQNKVTAEQYLASVGKTVEQLQAEMSVGATQRIKNSLVLSEVARTEEITVEDADVDAKLAESAEQAGVSVAAVRAYVESQNGLDRYRDQALTEKILTYLKGVSKITERTLTTAELEAEEAAKAGGEAPAVEAAPAEEKPKKKVATKKKVEEPAVEAAPAAAEAPAEEAKPKRRTKKTEAETPAES